MRCEKAKHWISEALDGRLPEKDRMSLDAHLRACAGCRAYEAGLEKIQREAVRTMDKAPGPDYFAASLARLRSKLAAEAAAAPRNEHRAPAWAASGRWAWAGAGSLLIAVLAVFFAVSRPRPPQEFYPVAFDEPLASFEHQIADNPEVAADFEKAVRTSLRETAPAKHSDVEPLLADHTMLVEGLTDDEVLAFDTAVRSEISHAQGRI
jgi:hypothetical protein